MTTLTVREPADFHMPAEWEPHEATWLAWPHFRDDWPGKFEPIPWVYAEIIRHLGRHERVEVIVNDLASEKRARKILDRANALCENVRFHRWPTNRVWTRDSGCTFVKPNSVRPDSLFDSAQGRLARRSPRVSEEDELAAVKWRFNAWAKYPNYQSDEKIGSLMAKAADARELRPLFGKQRIVLEGGSIDVNGQGTLLTTEECLLSKVQQRNLKMKRSHYEDVFAEYLGIKNVIWLGSGIAGDDTHGHVDDITRFVAPDTVVTAVEASPDDSNYEPLRENIRRLRAATNQDGKPLAIIELPMPAPVVFEGRRLPASYANFYIANGVVLVPVFNDPNDRIALDTLADVFPDREVVGIYSGDLIWGFGAMHCMTQQQPGV
ncbi:MAG: agmatine deiminase family protein [Terriglobales bacterium]